MASSKKNILFIINPISGGRSKRTIETSIIENLDHSIYDYKIAYTNAIDHARELSQDAAFEGYNVVVAVGGDGTVNEVARGILSVGTETALGIIPFGSGNGLARHLNIPLQIDKAIKVLNKREIIAIDTAEINGEPFFNTAGAGFDAYVSFLFANDRKRGFSGYARVVFGEFAKYKPQEYSLVIDGKRFVREAFMLSFANSSQFGNNAHIAPKANLTDGLLDVVIVKAFPIHQFPILAFRLLARNVDKSDYVEIVQGKEITVERLAAGPVHLDGEPRDMGADLSVKISSRTLKVLCN